MTPSICPQCGRTNPSGEPWCEGCGELLDLTRALPTLGAERPPFAGHFAIVREIGRGEFGVVYLARDTVLDREAALKIVAPAGAPGSHERDAFTRRFLREARAAASLHHPHIVAAFEAGTAEDAMYLAMEYVKGSTLRALLSARGALSVAEVAGLGRDLCGALAHAHERGLVHRDIKPENVLVAEDGTAKLADFGICKPLRVGVTPLTTSGTLLGTPCYMAPEQVRGQDVDGRSDLFSLAAVLYESLTGQKAFPGGELPDLLNRVMTVDPVAPCERLPGIPESVSDAIMRALDKDRTRRFGSASELAEALLGSGQEAAPTLYLPTLPRGFGERAAEGTTRKEDARAASAERRRAPIVPVVLVSLGALLFLAALALWAISLYGG